MENIVLATDLLRVEISPRGAEMQSVLDQRGSERLWNGDPAVWGYHAPVLFPVAGAFTGDRFSYKGVFYPMKRHGFARTSQFKLVERDRSEALFLLDEPQENYPFSYRFYVRYSLAGDQVKVCYTMENTGGETMYASAGSHEAYRFTGELEDWFIRFEQPESLIAHELIDAQIGDKTRCYGEDEVDLPLSETMFDCDTLVFAGLQSRRLVFRSLMAEKSISLDFKGMDYLLLWKKPGAPFLCIEPWCNPPEPVGFEGSLADKPGIIRIEPGEQAQRTHIIGFL